MQHTYVHAYMHAFTPTLTQRREGPPKTYGDAAR